MNPRLLPAALLVFCFLSLQPPFVRESRAQWASSSSRDFGDENRGDFIMLQWDPTDSAAWYFVYVAYSSNGPWSLLFEISDTSRFEAIFDTPRVGISGYCFIDSIYIFR
jgi:hypothetical protein